MNPRRTGKPWQIGAAPLVVSIWIISQAHVASPAAAQLAPEKLFTDTQPLWGHVLSPDGKSALVRRRNGTSYPIDVMDLEAGTFTGLRMERFVVGQWHPDGQSIFARTRRHLYRFDLKDRVGGQRGITPTGLGRWRVVGYPRIEGTGILVAAQSNRFPGSRNLYKCPDGSALGAKCELVSSDFSIAGAVVRDVKGNIATMVSMGLDGWAEGRRFLGNGKDERVFRHLPDRVVTPFGVQDETGHFHAISNRKHNFSRLVRINALSGEEEAVLSLPDRGVDTLTMSRDGRRPLIAISQGRHPEWHILDPDLKPVFEKLARKFENPPWLHVLSLDNSGRRLTVSVQSPDLVEAIYLLDANSLEVSRLATRSIERSADKFGKSERIKIPVRDGSQLDAIVTLPRGRAKSRAPLVVRLHGGPWARFLPVFDRTSQLLAANGYAVMNLNYRGSSFYGRESQEKAAKELLETADRDIADVVDWAKKNLPIVDDRIGVMGFSFGGFLALRAAISQPGRFKAVISTNGMVDMKQFWLRQQPIPLARIMWNKYLGLGSRFPTKSDLEKYLDAKSPVNNVTYTSIPVLVVAGARDARVSSAVTQKYVERAGRNGMTIDSLVLPGEGHTIRRPKNLIAWHQRVLDFLEQHL